MQKKHLIISSYDDLKNPYYSGGGAVSVHEIAKKLSTYYKVSIVTSRHKVSNGDEIIDSVTYKRIGFTPNFCPQLGQLIFQVCLPFSCMSNSFDIWMESFTPPFSVALLPLFTRKPIIGLVHFLSGQEMSKKYNLPFGFFEKLGLRYYTHFITPNIVTKKRLLEIKPEANIAVISNGIDLPAKVNKLKRNQIGYIGRIEVEQKGLDLLLNAFKELKNKKWHLVIAGTGPRTEEIKLQKLIASNHLKDRVNLLGRVEKKKKDQFFQNLSFLAVPSRFETFSLSALEGMSYGLPILSFDIPGLSWIPKLGSAKAKAFDLNSLQTELEKLISKKELRHEMAEINQKFAERFSWKKTTKKYYSFIEGCL